MAYYIEPNNLLNYDAWKTVNTNYQTNTVFENNGVTITASGNDYYTLYNSSDFPEEARIYCNEGDVFTLSWESDEPYSGRVYIFGWSGVDGENSYVSLAWADNASARSVTYVVPSGVVFITFRFGVQTADDVISYKNIMLNRGNVVYGYVPYEHGLIKAYTFNTNVLNVKMFNSSEVFTSGAIVTYMVDTNTAYSEEVDSGSSVLSPTTFTPAKSGWTFVGWREDTAASSSVLTSKTMDSDPITLYAVFSKACMTACVSYNNTQYVTGTVYYNNGNRIDASGYIPTGATYDNWTWRGWSNGFDGNTAPNANVTFGNGDYFTFDKDYTIYGLYQQTRSVTAIAYNNTQTVQGTAYYNASGQSVNGLAYLPSEVTYSGWSWRGWSAPGNQSANADVGFKAGSAIELDKDLTVYGLYQKTVSGTFISGLSKANTQTVDGTMYYNSSGNTANATITAPSGIGVDGWTWRGWAGQGRQGATETVSKANGATISIGASYTYYGLYQQTIYLYYNGNGATSGSISSQTGTRYHNSAGNYSNPTFTLAANGFSKGYYYEFAGWDLGAVGASVTLSANTTAYAQWNLLAVPYTVNLGNYPMTMVSHGSDDDTAGVYNYSSSYVIEVAKDEGSVAYGNVTASVSYPTQYCNKVRVKVYHTGSAPDINGVVPDSTAYTDHYVYLDCSGDTFTMQVYLVAGDTNKMQVTIKEVYFYYE